MKETPRPALRAIMAFALALLFVGPALAQALPPAIHVGMSSDELQAAGLDLRRVSRPERMANGARGLWQQTAQPGDDGLVFDITYFVRGASVDRIDLQLAAAPDGPMAAYERIVATLRTQLGSELRSKESVGNSLSETASWAAKDQDVAAYLSGARDAEKVRIVYKRRELKDASTL